MPKFHISLLVAVFIWGCAAKTTTIKAMDAEALKIEIKEICSQGGRKEDVIYFIENSDNVRAKEIVRQLGWDALGGCDYPLIEYN